MSTDISAGYDLAQFFLGPGYNRGYVDIYEDTETAGLVLVVGGARSVPVGFSKNWGRASGIFAIPTGDITAEKAAAVAVVATSWAANKTVSADTLKALFDADLTDAGYTRPNGAAIT